MRDKKRLLSIIGAVFTTVGLALLITAAFTGRNQQLILATWPRVEAQVIRSRVSSSTSFERNRGTNVATYLAVIEFRYNVAGKSYDTPASTQVSTSNYAAVKRQVDAYAPGTVHTIVYNPEDPNDIRFDAGHTWSFFFLPALFGGMGIIFGIVGVSLLAASRTVQIVRCPSCGAIVEREQKFCSNCATPLAIGT